MEPQKAIYAMRKVKNMCAAFDDDKSCEAIDFVIELLQSAVDKQKLQMAHFIKPRPEPGYRGPSMKQSY